MRVFFIFTVAITLAGCASPSSDVARAWHGYRSVKIGMTVQEVHAVIGAPPERELIVGGPYREYWAIGDLSNTDACGASVRVFYDGGPEDGRVTSVVRSFHRPDVLDSLP